MTEAVLLEEEVREPLIGDLLGDVHLTDTGNAARLSFLHGDRLRWSPAVGWLHFNGRYWEPTDDTVVMAFARDVPKQLVDQAAESDEPGLRSLLCGWAIESEEHSKIRSMVSLLRSEPGIRVEVDSLDKNPWLLNLENGTLDLKTGKLRNHNSGDLLTKLAGTSFDPDAQCPRWEQFILEVLDGEEDLANYLRRFCGYLLTGSTKEQCFLFLSGVGANGKGVFTETLARLMGDYGEPLSPSALLVKQGEQTNEIASLRGARYVFCSEVEPGKTLDTALLKALTGEDSMRVRFLYREFFTMKPCFKILYSANGMPKVRDSSYGFWRRCKHVPFNRTFSPDVRDAGLRGKLEKELPGILNWCLSGLQEWLSGGLKEPGIVSAATREYRDDQSVIRAFLDDMTKKIPGHCVPLSELHEVYLDWAKKNGERTISNRVLKRELEQNGITTKRGMVGVLAENIGIVTTEME